MTHVALSAATGDPVAAAKMLDVEVPPRSTGTPSPFSFTKYGHASFVCPAGPRRGTPGHDLVRVRYRTAHHGHLGPHTGMLDRHRAFMPPVLGHGFGECFPPSDAFGVDQEGVERFDLDVEPEEIGRASCRERV